MAGKASSPAPTAGGRPGLVPGLVSQSLTTSRALLLLAALVLIWGANWPIMKAGLTLVTPFWFAVARLLLGMLTLFAVLALLGRLRLPPRADLSVVFSIGLLQMALFLALVNLALQIVPAGRSAVLAYTTPLWVAPGAVLLLGERMTRGRLLGLVLGLGGLVVLFNPLDFPWSDGQAVLGNALLLVAALGWALSILAARRHRWSVPALELVPWQMLVAIVPLTIAAVAQEGAPDFAWSWDVVLLLAYNGPLATGLCYVISMTLQLALPAVTVSLGFLAGPALGVPAPTLALGEPPPPSLLAGMALILGGLMAVTLPGRRAAQRP